jgi:acetyltransferase-like isoleucine patch superfamily enzyme
MLNGEYYLLFDTQLVDEREQCKAALYRFNSSSNPALGISREERARHFRTIIEAPWTRMRNPDQPVGTLGQDVHVDAPFTCEYGYNIHVGDAVVIGSNCTILDSCRVSIGSNTIIGPNVSIFSNTVSTDPNRRNGSRGTAIAKGIEICDNVFIGGNVTILPGIKVGKGATIGAGSVVTRNVPPHVVVSGNPATVRRGIWKEPYN